MYVCNFEEIPLTLPGLGFFENLTARGEGRGGSLGPRAIFSEWVMLET